MCFFCVLLAHPNHRATAQTGGDLLQELQCGVLRYFTPAAMVQGCILFKGLQNVSKTEYFGQFCPKIQNTHLAKLHKISGFIDV